MISNEEFLQELAEDYADVDWDNIPDLETYPDVYHVEGMQWHRLHFYAQESRASNNWQASTEKDIRSQCGISFVEMSEDEAKKLLAEILDPNSKYQKEEFHRHNTIEVDGEEESPWSDEYFGPVINETMRIIKNKPHDAIVLRLMRDLRRDVLAGKEVFPIYLP